MFGILFGWSKASKCKKAIKKARCRLTLLKNKRQAIARQLRKDLAELIQDGHEETAVNRVEQLIEDESLASAYELLDHFCEFILTQLSYIRRHKDCPNDINEAVSSLIFASARCGDLPELCVIRKLFGERYGDKFATTAVELFPGNLVNRQLKENLSGKSVPDDQKYRLIDEIARDNCLQQVLAIQYYPDWQQVQVKGNKGYQAVESDSQINDTIAGSKVHRSEVEEIGRDVICVNSSISKPSDSCSMPESSLTDTSAMVSTVQSYSPYILSYPLRKKVEKVKNFPKLLSVTSSGLQNKGERMALASSAEKVSLPPYPEEMVDYVGDIEECQFSVSKEGACQDQRLFKFRSSGLSKREKIQVVESDSQINDTIAGSKVHPSEVEETERDVICVNLSISKPSDSVPESSLTDTSAMVSTVQPYPPYILSYPLQKKVEKLKNFPKLLSVTSSGSQNMGERMALASSAEKVSLLPYPEEMVDYVDDIEACQFSVSKDCAYQDQRLFKFRDSSLSRREEIQFGCDESDMYQDELLSEKSSIRTSRKSKRAPEKRSRRRSASLENLGIMDIGYLIYYHKPCRSPSAHKHGTHCRRKHQNPSLEGTPHSSYAHKRLKQHSFSEKEKNAQPCQSEDGIKRKSLNFKMIGCSLDHPCYFCVYDDEDCSEALSMKPKRGIRATHMQQGGLLGECCHELNQGMELVTIPQRPQRKIYSGAAGYHVFTYPDCQAGNESNETKAQTSASQGIYASPDASNARTTGSLTRIQTEAPYSRAMTMPQARPRKCKDKMLRTYSCPPQHPNHVHPKLPDYDDIAAKFTALKRERLENKDCCSRGQQLK